MKKFQEQEKLAKDLNDCAELSGIHFTSANNEYNDI